MTHIKIVEVVNLSKKYKKKLAINKINFEIKEGSVFGLLGPNGAGKSTTIKVLTGQLLPSSGEVMVCGINPSKNFKELSKHIGLVTDTVSLYMDVSVKNNLKFFAKLYNVNMSRVEEVIELMHLEEYSNTIVKRLSKGFKQRVLIARSILHNPKLIIMDEPTSGLDANIAAELRKLIIELKQQGKSILLTTHDMDEAEELCDQILIINQGEVIANTSLKDLQNSNEEKVILVETVHGEKIYKFSEIKKIAQIPENELISIHSNQYSLKDVFINLTNAQ